MRQILQSHNAILLASQSPSFATTGRQPSLMAGTINSSYDFSVTRVADAQIGSQEYGVNDLARHVDINFSLQNYLTSNFLVERYLNLDIDNFLSSDVFSTLDDEDDQNFVYLIHPTQGVDAMGQYNKASGTRDWSGFDAIGIGNAFLNSYSVNFAVGAIPTITTNWISSNLEYQRATGNSVSSPAINLASGNNLSVGEIDLNAFVSGGDDLSKPNVIVPGDVKLSLQNLQVGGQPLVANSHIIQSLNLNVEIQRSANYGFGSDYVYGRDIQYPLRGTLSFNGFVSGLDTGFSGFVSGLTNNESKYNLNIDFWDNNYTGTFEIEEARLQSYNYTMAVNGEMLMDAVFSFSVSDTKGLKARSRYSQGVLENNLLLDGAYTIHVGNALLLHSGIVYGAPLKTDGTKEITAFSYDTGSQVLDTYALRTSAQDDDHNNGGIFIHPIDQDLSVLVTDHNDAANDAFLFKGTDLDVDNLPASPTTTVTLTNPSYSAVFPYIGDLNQVDVLNRVGSFGQSDWGIMRSTNMNNATPSFTRYEVFSGHYVDGTLASDGTGLWLMAQGNAEPPDGLTDTTRYNSPSLALWLLDRNGDDLSSGGNEETDDIKNGVTGLHGQGWNWLGWTDKLDSDTSSNNQVVVTNETITSPWGITGNRHRIIRASTSSVGTKRYKKDAKRTTTANDWIEVSCYVKARNTSRILLGDTGGTASPTPLSFFGLSGTGNIVNPSSNVTAFIESGSNGWYHVGITFQATSTTVGQFRLSPCDTSYSSSFTAGSAGNEEDFYCQGVQYAKNPYSGTKLRSYSQQIRENHSSAIDPVIMYEAGPFEGLRFLSFWDNGTEVEALFAVYDYRGTGSIYPNQGKIYYNNYNKISQQTGGVQLVGDAGDAYNTSGAGNGPSYLGGTFVGRKDILFDRHNYNNNGKGQIVRAQYENSTWKTNVVLESSTGVLLRPLSIDEMTYAGGQYSVTRTKLCAIMSGIYYDWSAGLFDTNIRLIKLS